MANIEKGGRLSTRPPWQLGVLFLAMCVATSASAQDNEFELPPPRDELPVKIAGEVRLDIVFPFDQNSLCPDGAACIFGGGGGIGGLVEWRFSSGLGIGLGYDAWFLDGNGVNELSTFQALRIAIRYRFLRERQVHPWVGAALGVLALGDTFTPEAGGGLVDLQLGMEIELSATLAFAVGIIVRLFTTSEFQSDSDGVDRGRGFGIDGAATLNVGLVLIEGN